MAFPITHRVTHSCAHSHTQLYTHTLSLPQWRSCAPQAQATIYYELLWAPFLPHTAGSLWGETHLSTPGIYESQKPGHCLF